MEPTLPSPYVRGVMPPPSDAQDRAPNLLRPGGAALTAHAIAAGRWHPGDRVLDLGCGIGEGLRLLQQHGLAAIGLDVTVSHGVAGPMVKGRGESLPFTSGSFHGVLAECSLSVMDDPHAALAEVARVLVPGGVLVVTDLYARGEIVDAGALPGCLRGLVGCDEQVRRLTRAGLTPLRWEDHSAALTHLIGQVLFEHGSLAPLWGCAPSGAAGAGEAVRRLRPGYLLMVAAKGA